MPPIRQQADSLARLINRIVNTVVPPRCPVSGDIVEKQGMLSSGAWKDMEFIADPCCALCGQPFQYAAEVGDICGECRERPPVYTSARAALKYNDASRALVLGFKHADKLFAVKTITPFLQKAGAAFLDEADLLVPVPLHYTRLVRRRYNQAAVMAQDLSKHTGIAVIPDALKRTRATPSQGHRKAGDRRGNVKGAFAVNKRHLARIRDKTIILIDDVLTTGATADECAGTLLEAGAKAVYVLAIARAVKE